MPAFHPAPVKPDMHEQMMEHELTVYVRSKVHRILRAIPSFSSCERWNDAAHLAQLGSPLRPDESLLGYYQDQPGRIDETILFTDQGLYVRETESWAAARYTDILSTDWLGSQKTEAAGIELRLASGETLTLPVRGGNDRFRDAFEVLRFMNRVSAS